MSDLISRELAILKCKERLYESAVNNVGVICMADNVFGDIAKHRIKDWLEELPSAERVGQWIECEYYDGDVYYECSECKEDFCLIDGNPADNLYNYCPNCGSHNPTIKRMGGEEE